MRSISGRTDHYRFGVGTQDARIQSSQPDQNACIERFNDRTVKSVRSADRFDSLDEVRALATQCPERHLLSV
jgi:hypothetical protein